jgi:hypothetical protein
VLSFEVGYKCNEVRNLGMNGWWDERSLWGNGEMGKTKAEFYCMCSVKGGTTLNR